MSMTARATAREAELKRLMAQYPWLRRVRHKQSCGQSAAVRTRRGGGARAADRHARRRRAERPGFHSGDAARARSRRAARRVDRRPARQAQVGRLQETAIAHRQCGARRGAARRHPRHRLRAQGIPPRRVLEAAVFRWLASLPAGAGQARGLRRSAMSMWSTGRAAPACRITGCGTGCGSASSISPACGG